MGTGQTRGYTRFYADADGQARMEEREVAFDRELSAPPAEPLAFASLAEAFGRPQDVMLITGDSSWAGSAQHLRPRGCCGRSSPATGT